MPSAKPHYLYGLFFLLTITLATLSTPPMPRAETVKQNDTMTDTLAAVTDWQNPDQLVMAIEAYFADLSTATARFQQTQDNSETASGDFFLSRPGKMRFAYDSPNESFIVADGTFIYFWDDELEQVSQTTISSTLAYVLLQDTIELNSEDGDDPGALSVREIQQIDQEIYLVLELANDPGQGQLTVVFNAEPLRLNRWLVKDAQGFETLVQMSDWQEGVAIDNDTFFFARPGFGGVDR
ncbi:MAG: outer membrane lipoprotein carrier protein LolA [Pseudomonadota bacterium]